MKEKQEGNWSPPWILRRTSQTTQSQERSPLRAEQLKLSMWLYDKLDGLKHHIVTNERLLQNRRQ